MRADYSSDDEVPFYRYNISNSSADDDYTEPVTADTSSTLLENLTGQLAEHNLTARQRNIALYVIGNLDDNGYLTRDIRSMAFDIEEQTGQITSPEEVKAMFELVRTLDPAGIGAIDLRDCLLLQLKRKTPSEKVNIAIEIISHYFDIFSRKHYDRLSSALGISPDELRSVIELIQTLNPKPASVIGIDPAEEKTRHIVPDFLVEVDDDSALTLSLLNNIPELRIEKTFREADSNLPASSLQRDADASLFIKHKRDEASDFIRVLRMRQETLFKVMQAITTLQRDFFVNADDESLIRPMILKDISAITGADLSVISRATAGKYVATAYGIYPLKHFFNERTRDDDDTSSREIMAAIRTIIDNEDKNKPLSDEAITAKISEQGYDIARRTVAKYREKLGFPVARLRREI
jgi:RNA polymerase sigma-54 factor